MRSNFVKFSLLVLILFFVTINVFGEEGVVGRVVDGDTIVVNGLKIRLIGVNTPELRPLQPYGREAKAFTSTLVLGKKVRLEIDGQKTDRYGRELRHVYRGDYLLGEELLLKGLAKAEIKYRYSKAMKERFLKAENKAKEKKFGIWK